MSKKREKREGSPIAKRNATAILYLLVFSILLTAITGLIYKGNMSVFKEYYLQLLMVSFAVFALLTVLYYYFYFNIKTVYNSAKELVVILTVIAITVISTVACGRYINEFVAPISVAAVLTGVLVSVRAGFVSSVFTSILALVNYTAFSYAIDGAINFAAIMGVIVAFMQSFFVMFLINRNYTRFKMLWGACGIGVISAPIAAFFSTVIYGGDYVAILVSGGWALVGSFMSVGIFTAVLPIYESCFNVWTDFKLAEACSMSRPLLQRLANEAPGTFNHCLIVSNLCESCALAIGENPFLAKACGIYHDVGKLKNPEFFVENQHGYNPHDDMIPEESVRMITRHTADGRELLKEYRLPDRIADIAAEHHGTTYVRYFYNKAKSITEGEVDKSLFRYSANKPSTKISAIVMICDVAEAVTRSRAPKNVQELGRIIDDIINNIIEEEQFTECDITFKDLVKIKETIIKVIPSVYHTRIDYDNDKAAK